MTARKKASKRVRRGARGAARAGRAPRGGGADAAREAAATPPEGSLPAIAAEVLLARAPACVLISPDFEIRFVRGAGRFLDLPDGGATLDLLDHVPRSARARLRAAAGKAARTGEEVALDGVRLRGDRVVRLRVAPIEGGDLLLVCFEEPAGGKRFSDAAGPAAAAEGEIVRLLEDELEATRRELESAVAELERSNQDIRASTDDLANLLGSTDIATLFLDRHLRIKRYTAAVEQLFPIAPSDIGRPIADVTSGASVGDLAADAEAVIRSLAPYESQVPCGASWYAKRVLPYRTQDDRIGGVVITFTDVTELRRAVEDLANANRDLETKIEERTLLYRLIRDVSALANRTDVVADVVRGTLHTLCERGGWSLAHVYYYDAATATLVPSNVWAPETGEAYDAFRAATAAARFAPGDGLVAGVFETGRAREVRDLGGLEGTRSGLRDTGLRRALLIPITAGGSCFGVLELFSTNADPSPESLISAMGLVATELGHAMLRKQTESLTAQMESKEQQRIARDLHDGLGQRVSGIAMLAHRLRRSLEARGSEEAAAAAELSATIEEAKVELRALVRGMMPVYPDSEGLVDALYRLVDESSRAAGIPCAFESEVTAGIEDGFVTRHLYFIAQEALSNALRHAKPSRVVVRLEEGDGRVELVVRDDGVGLPEEVPATGGSGLRIMRHRAALLAARLSIESIRHQGTTVRCRLGVGAGSKDRSAGRSPGPSC